MISICACLVHRAVWMLDAAGQTQATVRQLSEQLRRFLDDQVWFENRRVVDVLRSIEGRALALREESGVPVTTEIDGSSPVIRLPMERPLYSPVRRVRIDSDAVTDADEETDPAVLFDQVYVDREALRDGVRHALRHVAQVGLTDLVADRPLERGLAELVAYLSLQDDAFRVVFDDAHPEQVSWEDPDGLSRQATLPRVTFARVGEMSAA